MRQTKWSLLAVSFAIPILGQTDATYLLLSSNEVSPSSPTTTVEVWATWVDPKVEWVFGSGDYDLTAGDGVFSNPVNVLNGPGSSTGAITGNVIAGAANGQFHAPPFFFGLRDNPILLATYEWTTSNFTPRTVSLDTSNTTAFIVAWWDPQAYLIPHPPPPRHLFPWSFTPGSGVINVVPAPAAWVVLALPLAAAARRRRL